MMELTVLGGGCNSRIYIYGAGQQQLVLKAVSASNPKEQKHLKHQFQILQNLNHRNVVKTLRYRQNVVFPGNKTDKQLNQTTTSNILVLEHASKGSLLNYLQKQKPEVSKKRQAFREVAQGLAYLHSQGIAHRDLKLQNILVFVQDGEDVFKICDFGFASRFRQDKTTLTFSDYKGTRKGYMAPEIHQCSKNRSKQYDAAKTDIFALGVILFALVFGKLPFQYALPTDSYFKKLIEKQFTLFWASHNSSKLQQQKAVRLDQMKELFQRMVSFNPEQRPTIEEVLKHEWTLE